MTLDEALKCADAASINMWSRPSETAAITLAAEVRRLQSPRSGVCQIGPPKQIAPTVFATWGIVETDEEFAERAGKPFAEVVR